MRWYKTGTINVTNGSKTVTGNGTDFTSYVDGGEALQAPDGKHYEIDRTVSATQLLLVRDYEGPTETGRPYAVLPVQGYVKDLAHQAADLIDAHRTVAQTALDAADSAAASAAAVQGVVDQVTPLVSAAEAGADLAQKWATQTTDEVEEGQGYGAKKYAEDAAAAAADVLGYVNAATAAADNAATSEGAAAAAVSAAQALRDQTEALRDQAATVVSDAEADIAAQVDAAEGHAQTSNLWANAAPGVQVVPGEYSARHWASQAQSSVSGSLVYRGSHDASTGLYPPTPAQGDYYKIGVAGTINGHALNVGDSIIFNGTSWDRIGSSDRVTSVAGRVGEVTLSKGDVGLSNVDNTSDAAKPVSTATQTALDTKEPFITKATGYLKWDGGTWVFVNETYVQAETDPVFAASVAAQIDSSDVARWDAAHNWGNHAVAGYLTAAAIGVTVQEQNDALDALSDLSPDADNFIVGSGATWTTKTPSAARAALGLGTVATRAAPAGTLVGTSDAQTLTSKELTTPTLTATASGVTAGRLGYSGGFVSYGNGTAQKTLVNTDDVQTLSAKKLSAAEVTNYVRFTGQYDAGNSGTSVTVNFANGQKQRLVLTGNCSVTLSLPGVGNYQLLLRQDATGNRTVTWAGVSRYVGSATAPAINTGANSETMVSIYYDGTDIWLGASKVNA